MEMNDKRKEVIIDLGLCQCDFKNDMIMQYEMKM